jgi:hypothetical protein
MLAILVLIRDALLALALAWVGVSFEQRDAPNAEPAQEQRQ